MLDLQFHHAAISVPDLEEAVAWYADVFDFKVEKRFDIPPVPAKVAMLRRGLLRFEIFEVEGAAALPDERRSPNEDLKTHGNKHVAFNVDDLDSALVELSDKGIEPVLIVRESFGCGAFIRDCGGNLIELVAERNS